MTLKHFPIMKTNENNKKVWQEIIIECIKIYKVYGNALIAFVKNNEKTRKNLTMLLLAKRILINIRAVLELAGFSYKNQ